MMFCGASHEGDWFLNMKTAEAMFPYMFAAHKYNYGRYGLYYVPSMRWLEPELLEKFCRGEQSLMFIHTNWTRKGHGLAGITESTESPQAMATWVISMNVTMTLTGDLEMIKLLN